MKKITTIILTAILPLVVLAQDKITATGQTSNAISTAVPFLSITPDARSGAMGDAGVATSPDVYAQHHNAAKYPFVERPYGMSFTYSPWLLNLGSDMTLAYLTGMHKFRNEKDALAFSLRYFSMGDVYYNNQSGGKLKERPNEFAFDVSYSRKLIEVLALAVTGRFIYSDLTLHQIGGSEAKPGLAGAADIGLYYRQRFDLSGEFSCGTLSAGLSVTNLGNKIEHGFLPAMVRVGLGFDWDIEETHTLCFYGEYKKLLVPTPPIRDAVTDSVLQGKDDRVNVMKGLFQSLNDAPGGFKEEMQEYMWTLAMEYRWNRMVAIRCGYFHESRHKGARQYFTLGIGVDYRMIGLDFSYLIPTTSFSTSPLKNVLRVGIRINFDRDFGREQEEE